MTHRVITHQLHAKKETRSTHIAHERVALLQLFQAPFEVGSNAPRVTLEVFIGNHLVGVRAGLSLHPSPGARARWPAERF